MAAFNLNCPYCGVEVTAETDWIGLEVECPACSKHFIIEREKNEINNNSVDLPQDAKLAEQNEQKNSDAIPAEDDRMQKKTKTKYSRKFLISAISIILIIVLSLTGLGVFYFIADKKQITISRSNSRLKVLILYQYTEELKEECSAICKAFTNYRNIDNDLVKLQAKRTEQAWNSDFQGAAQTAIQIGFLSSDRTRDYEKALQKVSYLLNASSCVFKAESNEPSFAFKNIDSGHYLMLILELSTNNAWWFDVQKDDRKNLYYSLD